MENVLSNKKNVNLNGRTFHDSVFLVEDPKNLKFFYYYDFGFCHFVHYHLMGGGIRFLKNDEQQVHFPPSLTIILVH